MSRKRKELPLIEGLEITGVAAEGNALGRINGEMVVFVPFCAPGDIADIQIVRRKHNFCEGRLEKLITPSPLRVSPRCSHFTICGGCRWQHLPYDFQLKQKQQQVTDALQRIAKVELPEISTILGSENIWNYRNKMEYTFSNRCWLTREQLLSGEEFSDRNALGFHIPGAFDKVLDIKECHLQDQLGDRIRLFIRDFALSNGYSFYDLKAQTGLMRTLMIRIASTGEVMVVVVFGEDDRESIENIMSAIHSAFPEITSLQYVVNTKCNDTISDLEIKVFSGKPYIEEDMEGLKFRIGPKSFYQTNSLQAYRLYRVARELADLKGDELVYDLYTGTGTIANFIARDCRHVIGIEYVPEAIEDAKINAGANGLSNTEFYAGDMKDVLNDDFIAIHGRPDVIIIDPPRAGMHQDVVDVILRALPERLVYVSCNPATQARDIALLNSRYRVDAVQPVDMFPHTQHVESVVRLTLRNESQD